MAVVEKGSTFTILLAELGWLEILCPHCHSEYIVRNQATEAQRLYNELAALPGQQRVYSEQPIYLWQQQLAAGTLTVQQLRRKLFTDAGISNYYNDFVTDSYAHDLRTRKLWYSENRLGLGFKHPEIKLRAAAVEKAKEIEKQLDRVVHGKSIAHNIEAIRNYGGLRLVVAPAGVTAEGCYLFHSTHKARRIKNWLAMLQYVGQMTAYLLDLPGVTTHVYCSSNGKEQLVYEPLDKEAAKRSLHYANEELHHWTSAAETRSGEILWTLQSPNKRSASLATHATCVPLTWCGW